MQERIEAFCPVCGDERTFVHETNQRPEGICEVCGHRQVVSFGPRA